MELWIARDKKGCLTLFTERPERLDILFWAGTAAYIGNLPDDSFPDVTWENSPLPVKLTLA